jgi:excisionase family DNA binding protein
MKAQQQEVLSVDELATFLRVPKSTIYALVKQRRIPSQKVGRYWRFRKESIERWLENQPRSTFDNSGGNEGFPHEKIAP